MDQEKLMYFKQRLTDLHAQFQNEVERLEQAVSEWNQDSDWGVSNHIADDATDIYEREKNLALIEDRRQMLDQVEAALERIEDGTYGICSVTGKPIPIERLEVLPYAALSIEAQARQETH